MSKPLYEDVKRVRQCRHCGDPVKSELSNFCSMTCYQAAHQKDKVVRKFRTRAGWSREQFHKA